ncbi:MAG TPA: NTP transferase domain-containing protein [Candidatus Paceibacterota bacterium]|nr:NTP transferase domain-containing protein [Candidatus Paceibacterota bacterium]
MNLDVETAVVILAAGQGTRMGSDIPKALTILNGKPFIEHVLDAVAQARVRSKPIVVVSPLNNFLIGEAVGDRCYYATQHEPKGTGDAVKSALDHVASSVQQVLVLYADHPLVKSSTIERLALTQAAEAANGSLAVTMGVCQLPDFKDSRRAFVHFGRVVRSSDGAIARIVEYQEADDETRALLEVNPAYYCFNADWLRSALQRLRPHNRSNGKEEYFLTDAIGLLVEEGGVIAETPASSTEALGINCPEELLLAEEAISSLV